VGRETHFKFFYKPCHYTSTLVFYILNNKSPIFPNDHKHSSNTMTHFMQHKQMPIEFKCNIFTLGLCLQIPHHVENIINVVHQVIKHLKLGVMKPLQQIHLHCIQIIISNSDNDKGHKILYNCISTLDQLAKTLHRFQHGQHITQPQDSLIIT
jgi:hypothetical protein